MKKIAILTTFFSKNYGAALQAYALQKKLKNWGYEAEDIQYEHLNINKTARSNKKPFSLFVRKIKNFIIKIKLHFKKEKEKTRNNKFEEFVNQNLVLSNEKLMGTKAFFEKLPNLNYDVYICGSDQIWNPIAYHFDPVYLLDFETKAKLVAYAPSIAYINMTEEEKKKMANSLKRIDNISVREKSAAQLLSQYVEKEITVVPDPTFLIEKNEWLDLKSNFSKEENFVLVYMLQYNENPEGVVRKTEEYAMENNCKIICLPYADIKFNKKLNVQYRYDVAPNDFIHLLNNCQMIFTNSFHAAALSINLNKDFYIFSDLEKHSGIESRLVDLLAYFDLQERMVSPNELREFTTINFENANKKLVEYRKIGETFLKEAIEG